MIHITLKRNCLHVYTNIDYIVIKKWNEMNVISISDDNVS